MIGVIGEQEDLLLACGLGPLAALTRPRRLIHYRSASSPLSDTKKNTNHLIMIGVLWCGQEDLNLHEIAFTRT